MNLSFWEVDTFLSDADFVVIGAGIVGLNAAIRLRELHPSSSILVIERGSLPSGASTKNAGFACFGSISELEDDLEHVGLDACLALVEKRWKGLLSLRQMHGDGAIDYRAVGGLEVFTDKAQAQSYFDRLSFWNDELRDITGPDTYSAHPTDQGLRNFHSTGIFNRYEGLIHTGKMMESLMRMANEAGIRLLTGFKVDGIETSGSEAILHVAGQQLKAGQILMATNAFTSFLFEGLDITPARNQVLVTEPLPGHGLKAGYHFDRGYVYFRPIGDRILLGGARNQDPQTEETAEFGETAFIREELLRFLREHLNMDRPVRIDHYWSGIIATGKAKTPIVKRLNDKLCVGVRLGGMGVAIGTQTGRELAELCH